MSDYTQLPHRVESDLIMACATTMVTEERRSAIRLLVGECRDWEYFLQACLNHRVSSLICHTLEANAADLVPKQIQEVLRGRFRANACRNLFLTHELLLLIQQFRSNGIEVIPFKGLLLAITSYGNVALREFVDLDILVPKKDFRRACTLMADWGYRSSSDQAGQIAESHFKSQLGLDFFREDGRVTLELHWSFVQAWLGFNADLRTIWARSQPVKVGQVSVLDLPTDVALLYYCAHGAKHRWSRLCWLVDVAEVIRRQTGLNWEALLAQAESSGCQRTLFIGLQLAKNLLGASIPVPVSARIEQDKQALLLAHSIGLQMFTPDKDFVHQQFGWERDWFNIRTKERWREKLIYLSQLVVWFIKPNEKDRTWVHLPRGFHWLYPVIRPIRIALPDPSNHRRPLI